MKKPLRPLPLLVLPLLFAGCLGAGSRPGAPKRTFLPVAEAPAARLSAPRFGPVKIRSFRALPPFDARSFIVRRAGSEFAADYYNAWIAPPQDLIRVQTARYLERTGLFSAVYDASSGTLPELSLEGVVSEFFLDCGGGAPAAVVTLRLLVLDERAPGFTVLFSAGKTGRALAGADPALAFGQALTQALAALAQALGEAAGTF